MNTFKTALGIAQVLQAVLPGVNIYAHDITADGARVDEVQLPFCSVQVSAQPLTGGANFGRMKAIITLASQSDDETSEAHSEREQAIIGAMAALEAGPLGDVTLCGRPSLQHNDPDVEARAFVTPFTYALGVHSESA